MFRKSIQTAQFDATKYPPDTTTPIEQFYPIEYCVSDNNAIGKSGYTILISQGRSKILPYKVVIDVPIEFIESENKMEVLGVKKLYVFRPRSNVHAKTETVIRNRKMIFLYKPIKEKPPELQKKCS